MLTVRELSCMVRTQSGLWAGRLQGFMYLGGGAGAGAGGCLHWHLQDPVPSENPAKIDRQSWLRGHELTLSGLYLVQVVSLK